LVTFVVPTAFALTLWTYFNWLILGQSLYWIHNETPTFGEALSHAPHLTVSRIVTTLLSLNWHLFALTLPVGIALVVVGVVRRNLITVVVALTVLLNPVLTGVLVAKTGAPNLFQLRYNMRAMPLAIVGVAWLLYSYRSNLVRLSIGVSAIVLLAVSIPLTWNTMRTYPIQFDEQSFTRALLSGHSQEGTVSVVQYQIGIQHELDAASWIESRVHRPHRVLTDDAQSYDLMLLSGNPSLFLDRIDVGDARWHDVLNDPFGRVSYLLVSRIRRIDLVNERYPQLLKGGLPGFHLVYRNAHWSIFSVSSNPVRRGEAPAQPSK
jgi:hypothetical protein